MKRIVSLVLALSMVLSMFSFAFAGTTLPDVEGTDYEAAVSALVELGIVDGFKEDGTYRPEEAVTRAQMAKFLVVSAGLEPAADVSKGATSFSDVDANHWASGYINVATEYGYINGYPEGTFAPEATVSYAEAVTMAIRVLGYKSVVESKGSWPTNYIAKAQELKVLEDVDYGKYTDGATRGNVALLMWNMLTTNMWDVTSENESNGLNYSDANGVTMIDKYFEDYSYIDEDEEIRVTGITVEADGEVWVTLASDRLVYDKEADDDVPAYSTYTELARDVDFLDLYGRTVSVLYNDEDEEIVMLIPSNKDKVVEGYDAKLVEKEYTLPQTSLVWGTTEQAADTDYVAGVIDTKKIVKYATRYQTAADNYIVEEVDASDDDVEVTALDGSTLTVDEDAIVLLDGAWLGAKDIKEGDILTVLKAESDKATLVVVSREVVVGEFEAVTDKKDTEDTYYYLTVDGTKYESILDIVVYEIDEDGDELPASDLEDLDDVIVDDEHRFYGEEASLYLNFLGEVVRIEMDEVIDPEAEGEFYVLTNAPEASWTASDKSGTTTYVELNGETYEVKTTAEKMENFDYTTLVPGTVVSVNFDKKDRVIAIVPVEVGTSGVEDFTFIAANTKMNDQKYVDETKIASDTLVYTITEVEDDEKDIIGYEVEITKGSAALKGVDPEDIIAMAIEGESTKAAYVFVTEEAKSTDVLFAVLKDYTLENGVEYATLNGKVYEIDQDEETAPELVVSKENVTDILVYTVDDKAISVKMIVSLPLDEDDLVLTVDGEIFTTTNITGADGDFDVIADEHDDIRVFLVKAKKVNGEYQFSSCTETSLESIKLDENEDYFMMFTEEAGDAVEAIMVVEGYKAE